MTTHEVSGNATYNPRKGKKVFNLTSAQSRMLLGALRDAYAKGVKDDARLQLTVTPDTVVLVWKEEK